MPIDDDVTDSYANVPALFTSFLQAQEQYHLFLILNANRQHHMLIAVYRPEEAVYVEPSKN